MCFAAFPICFTEFETEGEHGEEGKIIGQAEAVPVFGISHTGGGICSSFSASVLRVE